MRQFLQWIARQWFLLSWVDKLLVLLFTTVRSQIGMLPVTAAMLLGKVPLLLWCVWAMGGWLWVFPQMLLVDRAIHSVPVAYRLLKMKFDKWRKRLRDEF